MAFEIFGTAHLGEARCICSFNPEGCPVHQVPERIPSESGDSDGT